MNLTLEQYLIREPEVKTPRFDLTLVPIDSIVDIIRPFCTAFPFPF